MIGIVLLFTISVLHQPQQETTGTVVVRSVKMQCTALTKTGVRCKRKLPSTDTLCWQHRRK